MRIIFWIFLVLVVKDSQQSIHVRFEERLETVSSEGRSEKMKRMIEKAHAEMYDVYNFTQIGNISLFRKAEEKFQPIVSFEVISPYDDNYYWKDFSNNELDLSYFSNNAQYSVKDKLPTVDWELDFDTQRILGYNCNSAFAKNNCLWGTTFDVIKVWYTTEIPISNGPYLFQGLPGMILKVEMSNWQVKRTIVAKEITLNKTAEIVIPNIKAEKEASFDELCQMRRKYQRKRRNRVKFNKK